MKNFENIKKLCDSIKQAPLKDLFNKEENRFQKYSIKLEDLLFDYSKNYINKEILNEFIKTAEELNIKSQIDAMFSGKKINFTENRAVLHTALRNKDFKEVIVDGVNYYNTIWDNFERMTEFAEKVRSGEIRGVTGKKLTDIVNIGIGGSHLGIQMAYEALYPYKDENITVHFVSNVDGSNLAEVLKVINPENTLFIVASKTFTTQETMTNAVSAKKWLQQKLGNNAVEYQFVALSTNMKEVEKFGINKDFVFGFEDFIGGRYSLWSPIGLALVISIGKYNFEQMLSGAKTVDEHFKTEDLSKNIPFILAVIGIIYRNYFDYRSICVLPYDYYLKKLPTYLQQVDMESNGKYINKYGEKVSYRTAPALFGEPGTDGQHSFYQMLHQGTDIIPIDFIGSVQSHNNIEEHHDMLISNLFAQAEALMVGKTKEQVVSELKADGVSNDIIEKLAPHKVFEGNRPSNMFLFKKMTPYALGMLCAIYEHKVFVEGFFWEINSYDQWGVELGKQLAKSILEDIKSSEIKPHDSSTYSLIEYYKSNK